MTSGSSGTAELQGKDVFFWFIRRISQSKRPSLLDSFEVLFHALLHMASENWFVSLLCNLIAPIFILNRLSERLGPSVAVVVALCFPLGYGVYFLLKNRKINPISVLGLLNVTVTGSLALSGLTGIYFAMKEAVFPALIGVFVLISSWSQKPFMSVLLLNPQVMEIDKLNASLKERAVEPDFQDLLRLGSRWLSLSFFLSSVLNFSLATRIFLEIDPQLSSSQKSMVLNDQIARMTGWAALVTVLPSMILMTLLLLYLLKRVEKMTGQNWQTFVKQ